MRAGRAWSVRVAACVCLTVAIAVGALVSSLPGTLTTARAAEGTFSTRASTLSDYRQRVRQALDLTIAARPHVAGSAAVVEQLAIKIDELLPPIEVVEVGGQDVLVDNSMLRSIVESLHVGGGTPDMRVREVQRMQEHLSSLAVAVGDGQPSTLAQDPAALKALLVAQSQASDPALSRRLSEWIDAVIVWIGAQLDRITSTPSGGLLAEVLRWIVIIVVVGLLGLGAWRVLKRVLGSLAGADRAVPSQADILAMGPLEEPLPPDALGYADELAGDGRFREAVRALMRGSVRALRHAGWLYRTRARTTAELLYLLHDAPPEVVAPMRSLSIEFDRAWYGHRDPGRAGFSGSRDDYLRLSAAIDRAGGWGDPADSRGTDPVDTERPS